MELILIDIFAVGVCLAWMLTTKTYSKPHPPGPKGLPLLGNMLDMPTSHEWLKAAEWKQVYGTYLMCSGDISYTDERHWESRRCYFPKCVRKISCLFEFVQGCYGSHGQTIKCMLFKTSFPDG